MNKLIQKILKTRKVSKKDLEDLKKILEEASDKYYNTSEKLLSDEDFDILKDVYESNSNKLLEVGALPKSNGVDVAHEYGVLVGTLFKANYVKDEDVPSDKSKSGSNTIESWLKNIMNEYDVDDIEISRKYDGNSVTLSYKNGKCIQALTRGRDGKGKDLTKFFKDNTIKFKDEEVGIKYEAVISYKNFDYINENLLLGKTYANPRSMLGGIFSDDGYKYAKYIDLIPLMMKYKKDEVTPRKKQIKFMEKEFGKDSEFFKGYLVFDTSLDDEDDIISTINTYYIDYTKRIRETLPYMIDGLVLQVLSPEETIQDLGIVGNRPKYAIGLKFPYLEKESIVTDIEFDIGNTGRITPCVRFEPVVFNGAVQDRISLANYKRFQELKLGKGSKVLIEYRNDTLSYCNKLDVPENDNIEPIPFIKKCPSCGKPIYINEKKTYAYCKNQECASVKIGKIERYLKTLDIKGIKENTIKKLYDAGLVETFLDLYNLRKDDIENIEGLGETSAIEIINAVNSYQPYDYEVLAGSSIIPDFGKTNSKTLLMKFSLFELLTNIDNILEEELTKEDFIDILIQLDGFDKIKANKVIDSLLNIDNYNFMVDIYDKIDFKEVREEFKQDDVLYNIVFTGFRDEEIKKKMELHGHKIVLGGVSKKTDILVCMDTTEETQKLKKAKELGKEILSYDEFKIKFNL